jgi:hypothetical protein
MKHEMNKKKKTQIVVRPKLPMWKREKKDTTPTMISRVMLPKIESRIIRAEHV